VNCNKKLHYRKEHSTSAILSWCTLTFLWRKSVDWLINHCYLTGPKSYRIQLNNANYTAITPFNVIQGHRFWYKSKAHIRLPIGD